MKPETLYRCPASRRNLWCTPPNSWTYVHEEDNADAPPEFPQILCVRHTSPQTHTHVHTLWRDYLLYATSSLYNPWTTGVAPGYLLGNTWRVCSLPGCPLTTDYLVVNRTTHKQFTVQRSLCNHAQMCPLNGFCLKSHPWLVCHLHLSYLISPTCLSLAQESFFLGLLLRNEPKVSGK